MEEDGFVERFRAVNGFANLKLRTAFNEGTYGVSYGGLIVGDENASGHLGRGKIAGGVMGGCTVFTVVGSRFLLYREDCNARMRTMYRIVPIP